MKTVMKRLNAALSGFFDRATWRSIETAPSGRELELAIIDGKIRLLGNCIRRADAWFEAETMQPVNITATHWRFRWPLIFPVGCC